MGEILNLISLTPEQKEEIKKVATGYTFKSILMEDLHPEDATNAEIILGWSDKIKNVALESQNLKWIQTWTAGVDTMPLKELGARGISITNSRGAHAINISEQILGFMLMLSRDLHRAMRNQNKHVWDTQGSYGELAGKTVLIVGVGHIGSRTAKLAKALGMNTIGVRHTNKNVEYIDKMVSLEKLNDVLTESDYVVNVLPLTNETHHLFNDERFRMMKSGAFYITVGRGPTTDTTSLLNALQSGKLAGAALDVFEEEPLPNAHSLWDLENVIITPHIAGDTGYYNERMVEIVKENLKSYMVNNKPCRNLVNPDLQY